jgi:hypothetical protein
VTLAKSIAKFNAPGSIANQGSGKFDSSDAIEEIFDPERRRKTTAQGRFFDR